MASPLGDLLRDIAIELARREIRQNHRQLERSLRRYGIALVAGPPPAAPPEPPPQYSEKGIEIAQGVEYLPPHGDRANRGRKRTSRRR